MKKEFICAWCGTKFEKYASQVKRPNLAFCSQKCAATFRDKRQNPDGYRTFADYTNNTAHMAKLNQELNPVRMTLDVRTKISTSRKTRFSAGATSYEKVLGRHKHRIVAEQILGRPLQKGEVVHHNDGDKRNNAPENIRVFSSQSEHVKWHMQNDPKKNGGDAK